MAWMIPATISPDAMPGERRVFEGLAALPDDFPVGNRRLFPGRGGLRISHVDVRGGAA